MSRNCVGYVQNRKKYTLCAIAPRLIKIIEARPALPYTTFDTNCLVFNKNYITNIYCNSFLNN